MKWILGLLIGMLIAAPAMAQVTRAEVEQIAAASDARILAKLDKINEELATVETELAVLKNELRVRFTALEDKQVERDKRAETEIRGLTRQLSFVQFLLGILVTGLLTVLLGLLKHQWDKRKADRGKLAEKQSEIDALRAEVERIKNTSGLVSPSGGRLENEVEGGSG